MTDFPEVLIPFEQARLEAETRKLLAEALTAEADQRRTEIRAQQDEISWLHSQASDAANRIYNFVGAVTASAVESCQHALSIWHRAYPGEPIEIVFNSPGGGVFDGMALFDYIQFLRRSGHQVTTTCSGMAASMGGILLQAGDHRVMGKESYVLIHEVSTGFRGKVGELKDEMAFLEKMSERVIKIFTERSKLTAPQIRRKWNKTDWWLDSDECLKLGLVDEVR